jgi:hypothetical protein
MQSGTLLSRPEKKAETLGINQLLLRLFNGEACRHLSCTDAADSKQLARLFDLVLFKESSDKTLLKMLAEVVRKNNSDLRACDDHYVKYLPPKNSDS